MILQTLGILIGVVIGLVVLEVLFVGFAPGFTVPKQPLTRSPQISNNSGTMEPGSREDVSFKVEETSISGWLYLPEERST